MKYTILFLFLFVVFASCSKDKFLQSNIDELVYVRGQVTATSETAFSGKYSSKIDATYPFSIGIEIPVADVIGKLNTFTLGAIVKVTSEASTCVLVFQIVDKDGNSVHWEGIPLKDITNKANAWIEIERVFSLPAGLSSDAFFKSYFWSPQGEVMYIDDVSFDFN